jgi:hypothetical protein
MSPTSERVHGSSRGQHLGPRGQKTYAEYVSAVGGGLNASTPPDAQIHIERKTSPSANTIRRNTSREAPPKESRRSARSSSSFGAVARRWTMNSNIDYYVKTGETARVLDLTLRYKRPDGSVTHIGDYSLDLHALAEAGVVTQRGDVFDIKVVRAGGDFWLGVRAHPRVRLEAYRQ